MPASLKPDQPSKTVTTSRSPENDSLYQCLFELMPGSVLLMDTRGFVLDANPAFCRQIGYTRGELRGGHVSRFSQHSIEVIEKNLTRLMAGEVLEHQVANVQKDGTVRHYDLRETAITLPDGSRGILALANDITERVRAEQAKLEMERQLLHADKLKSLGVLAGGIAHDFNNLLTAIEGNLELATMDLAPDSPVQSQLKAAIAAAHRAADLTQQVLAFSGRGRFVLSEIDLSNLVGEMSELLNASISKKASLRLNLASELPFVVADATQVQQIVMNLVTNASEALGEKPGLITITTCLRHCDEETLAQSRCAQPLSPGAYVVLEVRDTGCGMDEPVQRQLFDPFFTTKFTGRGLGMSAVLGIARGHNAGILVSSEPGRGTVAAVLFPAKDYRSTAIPKTLSLPPILEALETPVMTGTVLVADDEAPIRLLIEQILKRMGFRVLTAADGEAAVACFKEHSRDITFVILDLTMPKLDGSRTLAQLRQLDPKVKAVLTSGYDVDTLNPQLKQEGFSAFIRKPFQVDALITLVRRLSANNP